MDQHEHHHDRPIAAQTLPASPQWSRSEARPPRQQSPTPTFAGFDVRRKLEPHRLAARWLAHSTRTAAPYVVYMIGGGGARVEPKTFMRSIAPLRSLHHQHLLEVEYAWSENGSCLLASPYTGNHDGLVTFQKLLKLKPDGRISPIEARHAAEQLLSAITCAHQAGVSHGTLALDEVLLDGTGRIKIELYGFAQRISGLMPDDTEQTRAAEVRSAVEIIYRAVTGAWPTDPFRSIARQMRTPDRPLGAWLHRGLLSTGGFATAAEALAALPDWSRIEHKRAPLNPAELASV